MWGCCDCACAWLLGAAAAAVVCVSVDRRQRGVVLFLVRIRMSIYKFASFRFYYVINF